MPRLDRLDIRGFKSIRALDGFEPRALNVLIGANGAGKSNFIDLFHMLARMAEQRLQVYVAQQDGPDALLFGGRRRSERIEAEFRFDASAYHFSLIPAGGTARIRQRGVQQRDNRLLSPSWFIRTHLLG